MWKAIGEDAEELGFKLSKRRSRRIGPEMITDLDFADDIALIASEIQHAQELLTRLESESDKVGLHLNAGKTEVMMVNQETPTNIAARGGEKIKVVNHFK